MNKLPIACILPGSGVYARGGAYPEDATASLLLAGLNEKGIESYLINKAPLETDVDCLLTEYLKPAAKLAAMLRSVYGSCPVIWIGHSLGAHVAPLVASQTDEVAGVIFVNGHQCTLKELIRSQIEREAGPSPHLAMAGATELYMKIVSPANSLMELYDFKSVCKAAKWSALWLQCACDRQILREEQAACQQIARQRGDKYVTVPGCLHDARSVDHGILSQELLLQMTTWIKDYTSEKTA